MVKNDGLQNNPFRSEKIKVDQLTHAFSQGKVYQSFPLYTFNSFMIQDG